jgi:hypothetical protein
MGKQPSVTLPGGATVPLPGWAVTALGAVAVIFVGLSSYRYIWPAEPELVSVKQANAQLRLEISEYNRHIAEDPVLALGDQASGLSVRAYADACLLVSRRVGSLSQTRLLTAATSEGQASRRRLSIPLVTASLQAAGGCYGIHGGPFTWRYGARVDRCRVEVWRDFVDGCQHTQLLDTCTGTWQTEPDGTPAVRWTICRH